MATKKMSKKEVIVKTVPLESNDLGKHNGMYFKTLKGAGCNFIANEENGEKKLTLQVSIPLDPKSFFPLNGRVVTEDSNIVTFKVNENIFTRGSKPFIAINTEQDGDIELSLSFSIKGVKHTTG